MNKLVINTYDEGLNYWYYDANGGIICSGNVNPAQIEVAKKRGTHNAGIIVVEYDGRITGKYEVVTS